LREFRNDGILPISMASMHQLIASGLVDDEQIEDQLRDAVRQAQLAVEGAEIGVEQAENGFEKANEAYKTAQVMVEAQRVNIEGQTELARLGTNFNDQYIAIEKLKSDLSNFKVAAPISGVIERRGVEPFNMATPQAPAFIISDKDSMTVSFRIPRASSAHMRPGDKITLEDGGSAYTATITEISTMVDAGGLFSVKASVLYPPSSLYTGAAVKVFAQSQKAPGVLLIPLSALYYDNGIPYVFLAENGRAKRVRVEVGIFDAHYAEIVSGIKVSDRIINTWNARLADGVEIVLV